MSKICLLVLCTCAVFWNSIGLSQSQERVSSDTYYGNFTAPDLFDLMLFLGQGKMKAYKGKSTVELKKQLDQMDKSGEAAKSDKPNKILEVFSNSYTAYLVSYQQSVVEYQKTQEEWRASLELGSANGFVESGESRKFLALLQKLTMQFLKDRPMEEQTAESYYLGAMLFANVSPKISAEYARGVNKFFKKSEYSAKVRLISVVIDSNEGRINKSRKLLKKLFKSSDSEVKFYAKYQMAWSMMIDHLAELPDLRKANKATKKLWRKIFRDMESVLASRDEAGASPALLFLADEVRKDLIMLSADLISEDDLGRIFADDKTSRILAKERLARKFMESAKLKKAELLYREAAKLDPFSLLMPARDFALLSSYEEKNDNSRIYKLLAAVAKKVLNEKSPWLDFNKERPKVVLKVQKKVLSEISRYADLLNQGGSGKKAKKNIKISRKLTKLFVRYSGKIKGGEGSQKRIAKLLSKQKDYKSAALAYLKIANNAKAGSKQRGNALRKVLRLMDKMIKADLPSFAKPILSFNNQLKPVSKNMKALIKYNDVYVSEFDDDYSLKRQLVSAKIYLLTGHEKEATEYLSKLVQSKKDLKEIDQAVMLMLVLKNKGGSFAKASKYANRVMKKRISYSKDEIKIAGQVLVRRSLQEAKQLYLAKKYDKAVAKYSTLIKKSPKNQAVWSDVINMFDFFEKRGMAGYQIKLGGVVSDHLVKVRQASEILYSMIDVYDAVGSFDQAQQAAAIFVKKFPKSSKVPSALFAAASYRMADENSEGAAQMYYSIAKKFPKSELAAKSAILAGDIFMKNEKKGMAVKSFRRFLKLPGKKKKSDALRAKSAIFSVNFKAKTGMEKPVSKMVKSFEKTPQMVARSAGFYFQRSIYNLLKRSVDKEVDQNFSDIPLKEYVKVKKIKMSMLSDIFSVLRKSKNDQYLMAGYYEMGRAWAEYKRTLADVEVRGKKDKKLVKAEKRMASQNANRYFANVFEYLDSDQHTYRTISMIREGLVQYFPKKYAGKGHILMRPIYTRHIMELD